MIRPSPDAALRPVRLRPLALALLAATTLTGCEFTQSLFRGRSSIPEAPLHPMAGAPLVKPPSIVAARPLGGAQAPVPQLGAPPVGAELIATPAGRHIAILPVEGAPPDRGYVIREALAAAMGLRIDQAAFAAAPQAYRLEGRAFLEGGALLLEWRMMDSVGRTLDQSFERQAFTAQPGIDPWSALSDEALSAVGRRSADRLARGLAANSLPSRATGAAAPITAAAVIPGRTAAPAPSPAQSAPPAYLFTPTIGQPPGPSQVVAAPAAQPAAPPAPAPVAAPPPRPAPVRTQPAPPQPTQPSFSLSSLAPAAHPAPAPSLPPTTLAAPAPAPVPTPAPIRIPPPAPPPTPAPAPAPASPTISGFNAPSPAATAAAAEAPIAFRGVFGAPGDGDRSLGEALRRQLIASGERLVPVGTPGAMVLAGQVEKKSGASGDVISIAWRLEDAFGGGVGQVLQENEVPRGALDGAWGEDAGYAAEGALDGVKQLISAARKGPG